MNLWMRPVYRLYGEDDTSQLFCHQREGSLSLTHAPIKHHTSLRHPLSSHRPNIQVTLPTNVEVCLEAVSRNRGIGLGTGARRDFATVTESKVGIALGLGVERRRAALFVDETPE